MNDESDRRDRKLKKKRILMAPLYSRKDYPEDDGSTSPSLIRPVIIARPDRESRHSGGGLCLENSEPVLQPTVILKAREVSPSPVTVSLKKDAEPPPPQYHLAPKPASENSPFEVPPLPTMSSSCPLMDDALNFCDGIIEYLTDQPDFLVVGCLGLQGTGKSTIMSLLAYGDKDNSEEWMFKPQDIEQYLVGSHATDGVHIYISPERIIFIDTSPLLSASMLDQLNPQGPNVDRLSMEKKQGFEFGSVEGTLEINSLQIVTLIMSICHVVILIQDWTFDPNLLRLIQTAEMLKPPPMTPPAGEQPLEYFPHIVFLHNNVGPSGFLPKNVKKLQDLYRQGMNKSKLQYISNIGIGRGTMMPSLCLDTCGEPINLFLCPNFKADKSPNSYEHHPGFDTMLSAFRAEVFGVTRRPFLHTLLSERNWLHYASRMWEGIRKSPFFLEYSRLFP